MHRMGGGLFSFLLDPVDNHLDISRALSHTVLTDGMQVQLPPCPHWQKLGTSSHHCVASE